ncbi:MAG: hypothetical protein KY459_07715 [Acidobacteria bacterium]|nr:hypothetical protein [Acidobacteriota bacterium]
MSAMVRSLERVQDAVSDRWGLAGLLSANVLFLGVMQWHDAVPAWLEGAVTLLLMF